MLMILTAHIKTHARMNEIVWLDEDTVKISITAVPKNGEANKALIDLLAKELHVSKSSIELIRGTTAKIKQFEIQKRQ